MKRDLLSLEDFSSEEIQTILRMTKKVKGTRNHSSGILSGKTIGLVFQKPSNRTRVSFEVGIAQLGGNCIYLGPEEINLGVRETTEDVAKTLTRYLDGIVARTHKHEDIVDLTKYSTIPVINGLSDLYHPCQALTDLFSIEEKLGELKGLTLAYVGDGNNVCHSLLLGCAKVGMNMQIATPKGEYSPNASVVQKALEYAKATNAKIVLTNDPNEAVNKADVIYADVWVSMGQEEESEKRLKDFQGFQINKELLKTANKNYVFMHCLPAHRGLEVAADVIDGDHSIVFDQAENRLHTQKAILIFLYERRRN
ncbi:MAG: ornithine carbamoyltransferase [Candidatus Omnitrophica bacterium]|nr:ornithine carbamoyltransferase [Candidatus Omnitrophota bacterium]MCB9748271.1 ornithine carbamoyltransferase [Candidatus Omnitrophota bacterium]